MRNNSPVNLSQDREHVPANNEDHIPAKIPSIVSPEHFASTETNSFATKNSLLAPRKIRGLNAITKPSAQTKIHWLAWWRIDTSDLAKQLAEYDTLKIYQSARGVSLLCLIFSVLVSAVFIFAGYCETDGWFDCALMVFLGIFVYRGHRWAIVGAMLVWTFEKGFALVSNPVKNATPPNFVGTFLWWVAYMRPFYLALRVESERRRVPKN